MKKNPDYISIGKVSKEKNVTIKALRYYDSIGVFRPAYVDKVTNYRYYDKSKLYILDAILLCVELGIPLKKFEKYKTDNDEFDLRQLLYDGKSHGEQKIADIRKRLGTLSKTIALIEGDPTLAAAEAKSVVRMTAPKVEETGHKEDKPEETKELKSPAASNTEISTDKEITRKEATDKEAISEALSDVDVKKDAATDNLREESKKKEDVADNKIDETEVSKESTQNAIVWEKREFAKRGILTAPLEGGAADSKKILRLNMVAQLLGMTASYPAGRLYEYDDEGNVTTYAYILVEGYEQCEDKRLKVLSEGQYYCQEGERLEAPEIVAKAADIIKSYRNITIIESDIVGSENVELQVLVK